MIAVAGPLTNLLLAGFFALWLRFAPLGPNAVELMVTLITVNIGLFVFNLIPFPPLDGSRVLYSVAPIGVRDVMDKIERAGIAAVFIFLFVAGPVITPFISSIVGFFLRILIPGLTGLSA